MMRLDRWLGTIGIGSRKDVQRMIRAGSIAVNGVPARDPGQGTDPDRDTLTVNGTPVDGRLMRHVMLFKPAGLLTAARDKKQPTVMDLLPAVYANIGCMPVGRLDKDTTGLLLLTCDGELNHRLLAPGRHVDKRYRAQLDHLPPDSAVAAFSAGLDLGEFIAKPAELILPTEGNEAVVTVHEGKFHQVKRMFEAVSSTVTALHRESFGPLTLDPELQLGQWRELTGEEVKALYEAASMPLKGNENE